MNPYSFVEINDGSDRTISGIIVYDRDNGGRLLVPSGTAFPTVGVLAGELFYRSDEQVVYIRNAANTAWDAMQSLPLAHASTHVEGGVDPIDADQLSIDFVPTAYTRDDSIAEATSLTQLSAHLKGIDDQFQVEPVFGSNRVKGESLGATITTTANVWVQKLRITLTVTADNAGDYILLWSYFWNHDSTTNDFEGRIQVDDTTTLMTHVQEPKDSAGTGPGGTNQRYAASGFIFLNGLTAGTYDYDLDLRTLNAGVESTMFDARMIVYRES